jgi:hypothetical protein
MVMECQESLSVLNLLLLLSASVSKKQSSQSKCYQEITQLSLTILLVMSFHHPSIDQS